MDHLPPNLTVLPGGAGTAAPARVGGNAESPDRPPGALSTQERRVWDYICEQLRAAGIEHRTFGLAAVVVCKTYIGWMKLQSELDQFAARNGGSVMITTPNGHSQPHQLFYMARDAKRELLQWLPECCLTIPALVTARSKLGDAGLQDDLFGDLVAHATAPRSNSSSA